MIHLQIPKYYNFKLLMGNKNCEQVQTNLISN
jgi:hypothetical protein